MATNVIDNFPDISFIDNSEVDEVVNQMISDYQSKYTELTGKEAPLAQADPVRLILQACGLQIYQAMQYADYAGKMSFLKYSNGSYLDNLAALRGLSRSQAKPATTVLKFSIAAALSSVVTVPAGTRVTNGNDVYFATDTVAEIPIGSLNVTVPATCTAAGTLGNGFAPGELNTLVETNPYITAATNTTTTEGGTDTETDDALRDRIFASPGAYSVAGPASAYEYFVRESDPTISDVVVYSSTAGQVDICFVVNGNEIPSQALMDKVEAYLENSSVRPLTDHVVVHAPTEKTFNINITYYIAQSDSSAVTSIQAAVSGAVDAYVAWQSEKLGRDINPSVLIQRVMEAGAKRVEVTTPTRTVLNSTELAVLGTKSVTYGGLEND